MKYIFIAIALVASFGLSAQNDNTVRVQGKSTTDVLPDRVQFILNFDVNADDKQASILKLNEQIDEVVLNLTQAGLPQDSIRTENFKTQFRDNQYDRNQAPFYSSSQMLSFIVTAESEAIVSILNILSDSQGDFTFYPMPFISQALKAEKESALLSAAFQNAKSKAGLLANAGDFQLGEVKSVDFGDDQSQMNFQIRGNSSLNENAISFRSDQNFGDYILPKKTLRSSVWVIFKIEQ